MKLELTLSTKVIASVPVPTHLSGDDYYLRAFKRQLAIRHRKQVKAAHQSPLFQLQSPVAATPVVDPSHSF